MPAICLLTQRPNTYWLDFLSKFTKYEVYIIIDSNKLDYKDICQGAYPNIHFIQIANEDCAAAGFTHSNVVQPGQADTDFGQIIAWDKALYYFAKLNQTEEHVWMIEDDVFFYDENTLSQLDAKYPTTDLLSQAYGENPEGKNEDWVWPFINVRLPPPYYCAMLCAIRISGPLLAKVADYVTQHKALVFIEALIPTLAKQATTLSYETPQELTTILYRRDWKLEDINKTALFHPIKDMEYQTSLRTSLAKIKPRPLFADPAKTSSGKHLICDLKNIQNHELLTNINEVKTIFNDICETYNYTILGKMAHQFEPEGFTLIYMLSESHMSIHTFPERNYAAIDIYTCREYPDNQVYENIYSHLVNSFRASREPTRIMERQFD
jgi:S-adenosylmethionine decarboxylase proenzyme